MTVVESERTKVDQCASTTVRHPRPDGQDQYAINEVAQMTGLTVHTLRWYERIGPDAARRPVPRRPASVLQP